MKKAKWINVLLFSAIAVIICVVLFLVGILPIPSFLKKDGEATYTKSVKVINEYNIQIYLYGDDCALPEGLHCIKINKLDSASIDFSDSAHTIVIINDLSDKLSLDDSEKEFVRSLVHEKHVPFLYFGSNYLNTWDSPDYSESSFGERAVGYRYQYNTIIRMSGFWQASDDAIYMEEKNFLGERIADQICIGYIEECLS